MTADVRLLAIDRHWRMLDDGWEATLVLTWPRGWLRLGAFWGGAPGSHMMGKHATAWRTDCGPGQVHGWNARFGWWPRPCLTLLAHTRPPQDYDRHSPGLT